MPDKSYLSVYAKSFNWAGFFLPKETYKKCSDLYDFCRIADNIADDDEKIETKKKKFGQFESDFNQKNFKNPIIKNMWGLIEEFNISLKIVQDLLIGIKSDIKDSVKLNSKKDLLIYSYRVAGTVGLMMAKILRVNNKSSLKSAIDLGIAMQLTNISRDVIEDSKNNRFYINKNFEEILSTINLADTFYKNSFYSIKDIPISFRFSILVARRV
ncbi:squalene/phytoene synthase family protein, partial [Candidatus Pelagibacter sp.]|nr:squalene/phytoene synthase family protein [Candidatus Pelagibacter sp.]MDA9594695.1 squalene/phytoene synthase family protein [Candidatus Pelagibacter sp.]